MSKSLASLLCGAVFGLGLALSGMTNPAIVLGFLDFTGLWNPSLAFVMGGAVCVYGVGFWASQKMDTPVLAAEFRVPDRRDIDGPLVGGAVLFGLGWGMAGFCPGPAITSMAFGMPKAFALFASMTVGVLIYNYTLGGRGRVSAATA